MRGIERREPERCVIPYHTAEKSTSRVMELRMITQLVLMGPLILRLWM